MQIRLLDGHKIPPHEELKGKKYTPALVFLVLFFSLLPSCSYHRYSSCLSSPLCPCLAYAMVAALLLPCLFPSCYYFTCPRSRLIRRAHHALSPSMPPIHSSSQCILESLLKQSTRWHHDGCCYRVVIHSLKCCLYDYL